MTDQVDLTYKPSKTLNTLSFLMFFKLGKSSCSYVCYRFVQRTRESTVLFFKSYSEQTPKLSGCKNTESYKSPSVFKSTNRFRYSDFNLISHRLICRLYMKTLNYNYKY